MAHLGERHQRSLCSPFLFPWPPHLSLSPSRNPSPLLPGVGARPTQYLPEGGPTRSLAIGWSPQLRHSTGPRAGSESGEALKPPSSPGGLTSASPGQRYGPGRRRGRREQPSAIWFDRLRLLGSASLRGQVGQRGAGAPGPMEATLKCLWVCALLGPGPSPYKAKPALSQILSGANQQSHKVPDAKFGLGARLDCLQPHDLSKKGEGFRTGKCYEQRSARGSTRRCFPLVICRKKAPSRQPAAQGLLGWDWHQELLFQDSEARLRTWPLEVASFLPDECAIRQSIETERKKCLEYEQMENELEGCKYMWDNITCWPPSAWGQVVILPCPMIFAYMFPNHGGNVSRNCTSEGWTDMAPAPYPIACGLDTNSTAEDETFFYGTVKTGYTIGHSLSLIALTIAMVILCMFRSHVLQVGCKAAIVFFQYCIMANFFWLLVEGLYLHTLLAISFFSERKYFWWYILVGWGVPALFITAWALTRYYFSNEGCWDIIAPPYWWIIKAPILTSILVNFIFFICIIRILVQKLHPPDMGRNENSQYSRLAKSTLLLIPLFGAHYIMFAFFPDNFKKEVKLVFELILGSFQGFVVAILYCFLNGEVQAEIKRKWRRWHLEQFLGSDLKYHHPSVGSNGTNFSTQISMLTRTSPKDRRSSSFQADFSLV
ncbi:vasoactive intestinal polypeptide receptor 1 [Gracilinanus agilis]|uniref:vasoactive intestinal polypeptide receptor 1 n=1 Tax=Gracilinanus agilis TaxID=191870 RepID=UPI001CFDAAFA|nr:vasoactive intestinal polypeptide receptor 1 [Gracilinanus agilis]